MACPLIHVLAISGSLRARASNTAILEAARELAATDMVISLYSGLGQLPPFNPDLDSADSALLPPKAAELRALVGRADALLLSTPEYAHGLPGAFKNALDWLVGSTEFPGKPIAVINVSPRSIHAAAQLREVLTTMSARLLERASVTISLTRRDMDAATIIRERELTSVLRSVLDGIRESLVE